VWTEEDDLRRELEAMERFYGVDVELEVEVAKLFMARGIHTELPFHSLAPNQQREREEAVVGAEMALAAAESELTETTWTFAREALLTVGVFRLRLRRDHEAAVTRGDHELAAPVGAKLAAYEQLRAALMERLCALHQRL
jgi:hypothetical protein